MRTVRLRQAVVAASDRDAVVGEWRQRLALGEPFHDPGVEVFGLCNAVVPVGDAFLEVVSPLRIGDGCAAERFMQRNGGDCGYMAIFQVDDMDEARTHLAAMGLRFVWQADLDDIRGMHVHPSDLGGTIVSFDQAMPPSSWRWAGPDWEANAATDIVAGLAGITLADADVAALAARWSDALSTPLRDDTLVLDDGSSVTFRDVDDDGRTGLVGIDLWASDARIPPPPFELAGVTFTVVPRTG